MWIFALVWISVNFWKCLSSPISFSLVWAILAFRLLSSHLGTYQMKSYISDKNFQHCYHIWTGMVISLKNSDVHIYHLYICNTTTFLVKIIDSHFPIAFRVMTTLDPDRLGKTLEPKDLWWNLIIFACICQVIIVLETIGWLLIWKHRYLSSCHALWVKNPIFYPENLFNLNFC